MKFWAIALCTLGACSDVAENPSDDPAHWTVDTSVEYAPSVSAPRWIVPSATLPAEAAPVLRSNNNVDIAFHDGRLFLAWRTAPTHFASTETRMHLISSGDRGATWLHERTFALESDVREPLFLSYQGTLRFHFFQGGTNPTAFEPRAMWRTTRGENGGWSEPETWGEPGEVPWNLKVRGGKAWRTSYLGSHYTIGAPRIDVRFTTSVDGVGWQPVGQSAVVYQGGVSEAAFEFDEDGTLWAVTRNEDGDSSGWGSHVCTAPPRELSRWTCSSRSDPERYDSPKMFRHGKDLYLVARRDVGGPFDQGRRDLTFAEQQQKYLVDYWNRPKRTALYQIDKTARRVVWLVDLPSAGDCSLPSVARTGAHSFLVANYTSPLSDPERTWIQGQGASDGTQIYLVDVTFAAK